MNQVKAENKLRVDLSPAVYYPKKGKENQRRAESCDLLFFALFTDRAGCRPHPGGHAAARARGEEKCVQIWQRDGGGSNRFRMEIRPDADEKKFGDKMADSGVRRRQEETSCFSFSLLGKK